MSGGQGRGGDAAAYTWAHVNILEWPEAGRSRHLVRGGGCDSLCAITALPLTTWSRRKTSKPDCADCVRRAQEVGVFDA